MTAKGSPCSNIAKNNYNGKLLCNVHLNTTKANEECPICLTPMDSIIKRIKLACGHYFHIDCLGECEKVECPLCRSELTTRERCKIYFPTKVAPIFQRVFTMSGEKQKAIMGVLEELVDKVEVMDNSDMDVFRAYNSNFFYAMDTINASPFINDNPSVVIYDWVDVMRGGIGHVGRYGTYEGMFFNSSRSMLSWESYNPYQMVQTPPPPPPVVPIPGAPLRGNPRDPRIYPQFYIPPPPPPPPTPTFDVYEEEEYEREMAPSPVLPWYMQG
jgi:hypothetical protein